MHNFSDPDTFAGLLPHGFMWTPFCPDLDQAMFDSSYTLLPKSGSSQKLPQMCFPMASFGHISVQIWIGHFPRQVYPQKLMADLLGCCIWTPFCPDQDQAIFEPMYTLPKLLQICFHMASFGHLSVQIWIKLISEPRHTLSKLC